jgi:hypothetical protein
MGSRLNAPNATPPVWLVVLTDKVPACFTQRSWTLWLEGVRTEAVARANTRRALERGGMPDFCNDCMASRKAAMQTAGRCHPPADAICLEEDDAAA